MPTFMQALVTVKNKDAQVRNVPIPSPAFGQILVSVKAIALNPVDALYVAKPASSPGRTVGSDFAGVVEGLGEGVSELKRGDRIAGFLHGACQENVLPGAFAQYLVVDCDLVYRIPTQVSFEDAATLPLCINTASNGLFRVLGLNPPWQKDNISPQNTAILIYSGATSVGVFSVQLAHCSPSKPIIIVTASSNNHQYLKDLGADYVVDYHDAEWIKKVKDYAAQRGVSINGAIDCISEGDTIEKVSQTFTGTGKIAAVRGPTQWSHTGIKAEVQVEYMSVWTLLGKEFWYNGGIHFPAEPSHRALAAALYKWLSDTSGPLASGFFRANNIRLMQGGLDRIVADAFPLLGAGRVTERQLPEGVKPLTAEKMVYSLDSSEFSS